VLDRIPVGTAGLCDSSATVDQRGSVRPHGSACDAGSGSFPSARGQGVWPVTVWKIFWSSSLGPSGTM
jgi:hypothetical protein